MSFSKPITASLNARSGAYQEPPPPSVTCDTPGCKSKLTGASGHGNSSMNDMALNNGWGMGLQGPTSHTCPGCVKVMAKVSKAPVMPGVLKGPQAPQAPHHSVSQTRQGGKFA